MRTTAGFLALVGLACSFMVFPQTVLADEVIAVYREGQEQALTPKPEVTVTLYESGRTYAEPYLPTEKGPSGQKFEPPPTLAERAMYARVDKAEAVAEEKSRARAPAADGVSPHERAITTSKYSLGLLGGYGFALGDPPRVDITEVMPFVAFPISGVLGRSLYRGVFEYKVEPVIGLVTSLDNKGEAGLSPVGVRYNFTGFGDRVVPYMEGLLGGVYIDVPSTMQGSRFNFTESASAGFKYLITDKTALQLQFRYRHLSNAGMDEPNSGINTAFFLIGISHY